MKKYNLGYKILAMIICAALMISGAQMFVFADSAEGENFCGDINDNGTIDVADMVFLRANLLGKLNFDDSVADFNSNGKADIRDFVHMLGLVDATVDTDYKINIVNKHGQPVDNAFVQLSEMNDIDFVCYFYETDANGQFSVSAYEMLEFLVTESEMGINCNLFSENPDNCGNIFFDVSVNVTEYNFAIGLPPTEFEEVTFTFYYSDGFTPIKNADLLIFNMETHGFDASTDENGRFTMSEEDVEKFILDEFDVVYNIFVGDKTTSGYLYFGATGTPIVNVITNMQVPTPEEEPTIYSDVTFTLTDVAGNAITDGSVVLYINGEFGNVFHTDENGVSVISSAMFSGWDKDTVFTYSISTSRGYDPNNNPYADYTEVVFDPATETSFYIQLNI